MKLANGVHERGILFSGPMVRSLREGRKSQTRRVVKRQPPDDVGVCGASFDAADRKWAWHDDDGNAGLVTAVEPRFTCPYGVPGDRLWVRETWRPEFDGRDHYIQYRAGGTLQPDDRSLQNEIACLVRSDGTDNWQGPRAMDGDSLAWRPSLFMPQWMSRVLLEVVSVRVERVQGISEADAIAEGLDHMPPSMFSPPGGGSWMPHDAAFELLWDSINAGRGYAWKDNPWVWVVGFKRVDREGM